MLRVTCSRCTGGTHRNTTAPPAGVRAGRGFPGGVWGGPGGHVVKIGSHFFVGGFYHHLKATPFESFFWYTFWYRLASSLFYLLFGMIFCLKPGVFALPCFFGSKRRAVQKSGAVELLVKFRQALSVRFAASPQDFGTFGSDWKRENVGTKGGSSHGM